MDGENNGKPDVLMDDLGGKNPILGNTQISSKFRQFQKEYRSPILVHPYALTLLSQILKGMMGMGDGDGGRCGGSSPPKDLRLVFLPWVLGQLQG